MGVFLLICVSINSAVIQKNLHLEKRDADYGFVACRICRNVGSTIDAVQKNREMDSMESQPVKENRMIGWQPVKETRRIGWIPFKENRGVGWQPVKETRFASGLSVFINIRPLVVYMFILSKMIGWQPVKETRRSDIDNLDSDNQVDSLKRVASESPPLNVAFTYRISEDTGTIPTGGTVQFNSKVFDSTESFNPKTGEFIAPGCGMYVFMLNIRSNQGKTCWVDIIKDGDSLATAFANSGPELQLGDTTFVTIYLEKGNKVWAKNHGYRETVCTIDFYSSFAGFRLF
ncbi:unnamed protein product [Mytilus coruscus]|uniref:C1q domain-containing protein n=1 Tax=Mytilus coruscus TaxID=42192 RepID=A0A6J8EYQ6_MYTCO|nr:unnamed protein product [Mytilus coruscus]